MATTPKDDAITVAGTAEGPGVRLPDESITLYEAKVKIQYPRLSSIDVRGGEPLAGFQRPLEPGWRGTIQVMCNRPCVARRLSIAPLSSGVRVMALRCGVEPLLPYLGGDGISGTMFPSVPQRHGDRVLPWRNLADVVAMPGMPWTLEVENRTAVPIYVDALLYGEAYNSRARG